MKKNEDKPFEITINGKTERFSTAEECITSSKE